MEDTDQSLSNGQPRPYQPRSSTKSLSPRIQNMMRRDAERKAAMKRPNRIVVPGKLTSPHRLVEMTLASLARARPDALGMFTPTNKQCIPITVTQASMERAMLIIDTLIKAVEAKGWAVRVNSKNWDTLRIRIGQEELGVYIHEIVGSRSHTATPEEMQKFKDDPLFNSIPKREKFATGRLHLGVAGPWVWNRGHWSDTTRWRVEECLDLCLETIEKTAQEMPAYRAQLQADRLAAEEAERLRQEAEQRHREEEARQAHLRYEEQCRVKFLTEHLERLRIAKLIWEYAERLEAAAREAKVDPRAGALGDWLLWTRSHAEKLDPCNAATATSIGAQAPGTIPVGTNALCLRRWP